jgi:DNA-binding NtrC family response regulator
MTQHILVVDDEPGIREFMAAALDEVGFEVETAANGREALDRIAEERPELVLLDLQMPVMSGWEVLTQLQMANVDVPVVCMTAGDRCKAEVVRHHAAGFIAKPFELGELYDIVERFAGVETDESR